jgi:hypothetical protein
MASASAAHHAPRVRGYEAGSAFVRAAAASRNFGMVTCCCAGAQVHVGIGRSALLLLSSRGAAAQRAALARTRGAAAHPLPPPPPRSHWSFGKSLLECAGLTIELVD